MAHPGVSRRGDAERMMQEFTFSRKRQSHVHILWLAFCFQTTVCQKSALFLKKFFRIQFFLQQDMLHLLDGKHGFWHIMPIPIIHDQNLQIPKILIHNTPDTLLQIRCSFKIRNDNTYLHLILLHFRMTEPEHSVHGPFGCMSVFPCTIFLIELFVSFFIVSLNRS